MWDFAVKVGTIAFFQNYGFSLILKFDCPFYYKEFAFWKQINRKTELCGHWRWVTTYCIAAMRPQVPSGFRQPKFKYRMKIVLSRRHFAANCLKIREFGHRKPRLPECGFKNRPLQGNPDPWYNHPCWDPAARHKWGKHQWAGRWLSILELGWAAF